MPISIEKVVNYLQEFRVKGKKPKRLGDSLLGVFKGAIPQGSSSTELIRELRKPRYGQGVS